MTKLLPRSLLLLVAAGLTGTVSPGQTSPATCERPALTGEVSLPRLDAFELQPSRRPDGSLAIRLRLDGVERTAVLRRHSLRAERFEAFLDDGSSLQRLSLPPAPIYRGVIEGQQESSVAVGFVGGTLRGTVVVDGVVWSIDGASQLVPAAPPSLHVAVRHGPLRNAAIAAQEPAAARTVADEIEVAVDITKRLIDAYNGNTQRVFEILMANLNTVDAIFVRDVAITFRVSALVVRTTNIYQGQAYSLYPIQNYWQANHANVQRDFVHVYDTRNSLGVTANSFLLEMCRTRHYSMSVVTGLPADFARSTASTIGVLLGLRRCNAGPECNIMCFGFCSSRPLMFAPSAISFILARKTTPVMVNCMSTPAPPTITSLAPSQVTAHAAATVTILGKDMYRTSDVQVGGVSVPFEIKAPDAVTIDLPSPFTIATHPVTVTHAATGISNSLALTVTGTHPSALELPAQHPAGATIPYRVLTERSWTAVLLVSGSNQPSVLPGFVSLGLGSAFQSLVIAATTTADETGTVTLPVLGPAVAAPARLFWQAITLDPAAPVLPLEVSNVASVLYQ